MRNRPFLAILALFAMLSTAYAGDKLTTEELISKNIDSIITAKIDKPPLGRAGSGAAIRDVLLGGTGHREGKATFVSKADDFQLILDFNSAEYQGEQYTWSGGHSRVSASGIDKFSAMAQFVQTHEVILRDGLLGGTLNNGWALMTTTAHNPKMHYDGLKKHDGRQLHQLTYNPKKGDNDMTIRLYFEPDTFRHVATTYEFEGQVAAMAGHMPDAEKIVERIEETFSDFKAEGGLTLPHHWQLRYLQEHGNSMSIRFEMQFPQIQTGSTVAGQ
jgi:hypothetical protein